MVWIIPQQKYRQTKYACYDGSQKEHFCKPDENWGAFTAQECERVISLSKQIKPSKPIVDGKVNPEIRQVNAFQAFDFLEVALSCSFTTVVRQR